MMMEKDKGSESRESAPRVVNFNAKNKTTI